MELTVKSDPLNWLPFQRILGYSCPESFQTQLKLQIYSLGFSENFPLLNVNEGKLNGYQQFFWADLSSRTCKIVRTVHSVQTEFVIGLDFNNGIYDEMVKMALESETTNY